MERDGKMTDLSMAGLQFQSIIWPAAAAILFPSALSRGLAAVVAVIQVGLALANPQHLLAVLASLN